MKGTTSDPGLVTIDSRRSPSIDPPLGVAELDMTAIEKPEESAREAPLNAARKVFQFFLLVGIVLIGLHAAITFGLRRAQTVKFGSWNQAMRGQANAQILISGSSRAASHYDPRILAAMTGKTAFNIGRNGTQSDVQLAVLKAYLEHNKKPELVIHNLDAFSFVMSREVYDYVLYVPYLADGVLYREMSRIKPDSWKSRYIPLYGYVVEDMNFNWITGIAALVGINPLDQGLLGFDPRQRSWTEDFVRFREMNPNGVQWEIQPQGVVVMKELIEVCREKGVNLVLVYSPEFREMQRLTRNRKRVFHQFHLLARNYNVKLWDFSDWPETNDTRFFSNSQHLNAAGAERFSKDLGERLQSYFAALGPGRAAVKPVFAANGGFDGAGGK